MMQIAAAIAALVLLSLSALAFGRSPIELLQILVSGSVGSQFALEGTLLKSVPLLLTGLSVALAFRAGVWKYGPPRALMGWKIRRPERSTLRSRTGRCRGSGTE